jgi:hypothetical protein
MNDDCDLSEEIRKCRALLDAADTPGLKRGLLETLAKLTKEKDRHDTLKSRYLHRAAAERLCSGVVTVVMEELTRALAEDKRNEIVDAIVLRTAAMDVENTHAELKQIKQQAVKS